MYYEMAVAHFYYIIEQVRWLLIFLLPYSYQYLKYMHFAKGIDRTLIHDSLKMFLL